MQTKNITALSDAQDPCQRNAIVPTEKRHDVAAALIAERRHASTWWTILSEMRRRRELPEWAVKMGAGTHPSYDKWDADCRASNLALLDFDGHLSFAEGAPSRSGGAL